MAPCLMSPAFTLPIRAMKHASQLCQQSRNLDSICPVVPCVPERRTPFTSKNPQYTNPKESIPRLCEKRIPPKGNRHE